MDILSKANTKYDNEPPVLMAFQTSFHIDTQFHSEHESNHATNRVQAFNASILQTLWKICTLYIPYDIKVQSYNIGYIKLIRYLTPNFLTSKILVLPPFFIFFSLIRGYSILLYLHQIMMTCVITPTSKLCFAPAFSCDMPNLYLSNLFGVS